LTKDFEASHRSRLAQQELDVMNGRVHALIRLVFVIAAALAFPAVPFAQVKVIISGGFGTAYREVLPEFERTTGITVTTASGASQGNGPDTIGAQLRRGEPADVVILSREGLRDLIAEGKILAGTDVDLAETLIGLAVRAGGPKPDISTMDAFKQTLLRAKSVVLPGSTTGIYMTNEIFPRLGIADRITVKITARGAESAAMVARGDAELAIQPVSEILHVPGIDFVGTVPKEVQYVLVFAAAVVTGSKEAEASKRLIAFLSSERATAAITKSGMVPSRRR
jgi:molybdate transport system substrate-binding protein